jgi:thioredoxin-dependent adenylylsulfate APS reductase
MRLPAPELLEWALRVFGRRFALVTSFQREGMVLLDMAAHISPEVRVITLDTGRLPEETYRMMQVVRTRYGVTIEVVCPSRHEVESMVTLYGPDLFRLSVAHRRLCCEIRKVRPLQRQLASVDAWASGLRRTQSAERSHVPKVDRDSAGRLKLNPLADWTAAQVIDYIDRHNVPLHPLYSQGYGTIGCAPCTRPIAPGEHERAGRWWWEQEASKECGIHFSPSGQAERTVDVLLREVLTATKHGA